MIPKKSLDLMVDEVISAEIDDWTERRFWMPSEEEEFRFRRDLCENCGWPEGSGKCACG